MPNKININDPASWAELDWDEPQQPELLKRTDHKVTIARLNRLRSQDPAWRESQRKGSIEKYKNDEEYNKKRKQSIRLIKSRKIVTPFGSFNSVSEFNDLNLVPCIFQDCRKMMPHLYYYEDEGPGNPTVEEVVYTPYGIFPKSNQGNTARSGGKDRAFESAKNNKDPIALKYKDKYAWWSKVNKTYPNDYYIKKEIKKEWHKK